MLLYNLQKDKKSSQYSIQRFHQNIILKDFLSYDFLSKDLLSKDFLSKDFLSKDLFYLQW